MSGSEGSAAPKNAIYNSISYKEMRMIGSTSSIQPSDLIIN